MSHPTLTPELLAQVAREALDSLTPPLSDREIERRTGISRDTLNRRIASGELKGGDLIRISRILGIKLSTLVARAEKRAAA